MYVQDSTYLPMYVSFVRTGSQYAGPQPGDSTEACTLASMFFNT